MSEKSKKKLPELLCPAGSPDALDAAIDGSADAVYLGGALFNARMNAKNFGGDALRSAVLRAHTFGVKVYLTLNTLITDHEFPAMIDFVREAVMSGIDALIVADIGAAVAIHRYFPSLELHASTQMSGHNADMGHRLQRLGFSRMVIARETSAENLKTVIQKSPIEVEMFIHGALCVSHSGQCLFSSLVGGRSGNRGECAQPCRLPYSCADCKKNAPAFPLSLKDLSLAKHVPELINMGVSSLKIEGRMKSPEYVRDTAKIWRRLLDESRPATDTEMHILSDSFSRGGFTDAYYCGQIRHSMLGVRSEADKSNSKAAEPFTKLTKSIPLDILVCMRAQSPISMTVFDGTRRITVCGEIPQAAIHAPLTREALERSISKFGGTEYTVGHLEVQLDEGLMLPVSQLNDLRRRALQALKEEIQPKIILPTVSYTDEKKPISERKALKTARFYKSEQITETAMQYFDRIYLPLHRFTERATGVVLPPVIFDSDMPAVEKQLQNAAARGATHVLIGNLGHLSLAARAKLIPVGDFRLNATNCESVAALASYDLDGLILSPELTLPQIRDIRGNTEVIVYGRIPLMTLEKCVIREIADCKQCASDTVCLKDRRGFRFPVLQEWQHRNIIYNSLPTCMSDREDQLLRAHITARHFLFTNETPQEVDAVIAAYKSHTPLPKTVRRL